MHQRAVRIENILDDCIVAIREQGKTIEDCQARYPAQREELESLLRLVVRLQAAQTLQASPEFRRLSTIRVGNLVTAQRHQDERPVAEPSFWGQVRRGRQAVFDARKRLTGTIVASIVLIVSLLVSSGVVHASANDLPGDALYPVKRAVEVARLTISLDDAGDAGLHLSFAVRRMNEVIALLEQGQPQNIESALADHDAQMEAIAAFLGSDSTLSLDEQVALANRLIELYARHETQFAGLLNQVPPDTQPAIERALTISRAARDRALQVLDEQPGQRKNSLEPPPATLTVSPLASSEPPTRAPSRTPVLTPSFTPSPQGPSATAPPRLTRPSTHISSPTPSPNLTPPSLTSPGRTPRPTPERTPSAWPTLLPTLEWTPPARSTPPPTPERTPPSWSTPPPTPKRTPRSWPTPGS